MNPEKGEILVFNKPYKWTSFNVVSKVRRELTIRLGTKKLKVGHAGTLDPLATGVLLVCTGKATKQIEELQSHTKEYVAEIKLGATTPSFDMETPEDGTYPTEHITRELVEEKLKGFVGTIEQVPPTFSACKVDGKRAFNLARKGEEVKLKPKTLVIDEIELLNFGVVRNTPQSDETIQEEEDGRNSRINYQSDNLDGEHLSMTIRVVCSKGTYIRALARDIGIALGSGAYLTNLIRTRIGKYRLCDCIDIESVEEWLDGQTIEKEQEN